MKARIIHTKFWTDSYILSLCKKYPEAGDMLRIFGVVTVGDLKDPSAYRGVFLNDEKMFYRTVGQELDIVKRLYKSQLKKNEMMISLFSEEIQQLNNEVRHVDSQAAQAKEQSRKWRAQRMMSTVLSFSENNDDELL